jgi:molybdopterin biosynthesis enzyme
VREANLILTSAGVSVGAFDLVRSAIRQHRAIEFWRGQSATG